MVRQRVFWAWVGALFLIPAAACRSRPQECMPLASPRASTTARRPEVALSSLPRFQLMWKRDGLGAVRGASEGNVYYTVANDRRTAVAIDATSGKSIWETALPAPAGIRVVLSVSNGAITIMHSMRDPFDEKNPTTTVVRLETGRGQPLWSKTVTCPEASLLQAGPRTYLHCEATRASNQKNTVRELDAKGDEIGHVEVSGKLHALPGGGLCGFRDGGVLWCGSTDGDRLNVAWEQPGPTGSYGLDLSGDVVLAGGDTEFVARSAKNGEVLWRRAGRLHLLRGDTSARLLLLDETGSTLVRAADGATLARLDDHRGANAIYGRGDRLVIDPGGSSTLVHLLDGASSVSKLAENVEGIHHVIGDVMLAQSKGVAPSGSSSGAPLEAFSLASFTPAPDQLSGYDRAVAILQEFPKSWEAKASLSELQRAPDWKESLGRVIDEGPEHLRNAAINAAGESEDPWFLPALTRQLDRLAKAPPTGKAWLDHLDLLEATSQLDTPDAAAALLAFWQATMPAFAGSRFETHARKAVGAGLWRYSDRKEWVTCGDTVYPIVPAPPDNASLGTSSPSLAYVAARDRRWAVICEARQDDDGDGQIQVLTFYHGDTGGDQLKPYLVLGSGPGTEIDDIISADPTGRWVVVTANFCVNLVDTRSGKGVPLRGADGREGDAVLGEHRAASFSPDGKRLLYIRSNGDHSNVVIRDLDSTSERIIDPGPGFLVSAAFDGTGRWIVMDVVQSDTDGDGRVTPPRVGTTLANRRCRGRAISAGFYGATGDQPVRRFASVKGGEVKEARVGQCFEQQQPEPSPYRLKYRDISGKDGDKEACPSPREGKWPKLPLGPMQWKRAEP